MGTRAPGAVLLTLALVLLVAGCAGPAVPTGAGTARPPATSGGPGTGTRPATSVSQLCGPPAAPGRLTSIRAVDGVRLAATETGSGARGVVLIPELGPRGKCGWWDFATYLAEHGYHALLFDHRCTGESSCPSGQAANELMPDIRGAVAWLRQHGALRVVLLGASQGGSEALIAATRPPHGVTGVVALSADELTTSLASPPYPGTAASAVARLRLPALFAVASADPYVSVRETRHLVARAAAQRKHLVVLGDGAGHGWDLVSAGLTDGTRPAFSRTVLAFLHGVTS